MLGHHAAKKIIFENRFICEVSCKLHRLVKVAIEGIGARFRERLMNDVDGNARDAVNKLFSVHSSVHVWLR